MEHECIHNGPFLGFWVPVVGNNSDWGPAARAHPLPLEASAPRMVGRHQAATFERSDLVYPACP